MEVLDICASVLASVRILILWMLVISELLVYSTIYDSYTQCILYNHACAYIYLSYVADAEL